ncbi:hypothetical protein SSX86_008934 [Deinandra increscens subsp. villosa]|uniref:Leucine-rich repeat-containing N-terminal plant-type domain-containing protein n=1 Tax=Deinandra increscens subsp. villosa TaxID=3103831 RepID=A0AAP0DG70_9ASTR
MTNHIYNNCLHLVFCMLLLIWVKMTSSTPLHFDYPPIEEASKYNCIGKERDALLNFKAYISKDPYGDLFNWTREEEGGRATNNCCYWRGVTCNDHSHVTSLELFDGNLEGKISHSLLNLSYLNHLDLSYNSFNGTIPMFISFMTQLEYLDLSWNHFSGKIPSQLGNLTNLQQLSLDGFSLAKEDKWVNVITSLQKLTRLSLKGCNLSHVTHPYSYSSINASSSIVFLELSDNKLDEIPKYLGNLCRLKSLYFDHNSMPVKLSDFLNNFSGCTSIALSVLYASGSRFSGSLPNDIQKFSALQDLDLSYNHLNGTINERVWELPNLEKIDLSSNSFQGAISKNIGSSKIMRIILSNNSLDVFSSLEDTSNRSNVEELYLSSNVIYGPIPSVPSTVRRLNLSKNKFYGGISFLCQIVDGCLVFLDLSNNSLTGPIPDCLWKFKKLQVLNLGYNKLSRKVPPSIGSLTSLMGLYLNNNRFSGELPLSLKNCSNLISLDLGGNRFSGNVPFWIGEELSFLHALRLTSNKFQGSIPIQLCQLVELRILDLSINNLNGTVPTCLNNLTAMVKDAHPDGNVGVPLYGFNVIEHLRITWKGTARDFNNIMGLLKVINLSKNNLTGKIPDELADLHELTALDLSMNALYGRIPSKIGDIKDLQVFDLSNNSLSGDIPSNMCEMHFLSYLDVSYNNLSGRIPSCPQIQTFDSSRYTRNLGLCGPPLIKHCPGDEEPPLVGQSEAEGEGIDELERWFYIGGTIGFSIGFWTICSGLLLYRRGRHAFFHYMNRLEDWVYVKVMVFIAKLKRITHP